MNILKYRPFFLGFSALVLCIGVISLGVKGLPISIEFTGGELQEISLPQPITAQQIDQLEDLELDISVISETSVTLRAQQIDQEKITSVLGSELEVVRSAQVGATFGQQLITKTILASLVIIGGIILYIWWQFKSWQFGVTAILAMLHDSLVVIGSFSVLSIWFEVSIDTLFITALLTTLSFSIHDTIVVFDRVRELQTTHKKLSWSELLNAAIVQTLTRSLNNSMTIIFVLFALVLIGGSSIRWFATALLIGAITGTYSSTFVAAQLLSLQVFKPKKT